MSQIDLKEKFYGHMHVYRDNLVEFRVITPSPDWCWKTFFSDGISEHPVICFTSIIKKTVTSPPVVKVFSKHI